MPTKAELESILVQLKVLGAPQDIVDNVADWVGFWHDARNTVVGFNEQSVDLARSHLLLLKRAQTHA